MTLSTPRRGLYAITSEHTSDIDTLIARVAAAIRGGAVMIQYRPKGGATRERADALMQRCQADGIPLIVNDDPHLALALGADGVHIGRDDMPLAEVRTILGDGAIIGVSCYNNLERAVSAANHGASYVAFGSFFPSLTKPMAAPAGLELLRRARSAISLPIVAIGGITPENGGALVEAGADLLAVINGIFEQPDAELAARRYTALFSSS